mgnify:CR=1 FL=1|tara:strand:+ start:195 stop:518 length:324 start_codon:yes stop_codon:yes gene_type:complete
MTPNKPSNFVILPILGMISLALITMQIFLFLMGFIRSFLGLLKIGLQTPFKGFSWAREQRSRQRQTHWGIIKTLIFSRKDTFNNYSKPVNKTVRDINLRVHKTNKKS